MRFYTTQSALRLVAITLFSIVLTSCGQGDGPTKIEDPLFAGGPIVPPVVVVPPSLNLPVKLGFEDAGAVSFGNFGGGSASIIDNPVPTPAAKPNTSAKVGQMIKDGGETFGGSTLTLDEAFDFSESEVLTINVWASRAVPLTFKLEGASDAEDREVVVTHSGSSTWEELEVNFTGMSPPATTMVTLIFDNGVVGNASGQPALWTFYFDDIAGGVLGGGGGGPATGGTVPEVVLIAADGSTADLVAGVDFSDFTPFGSGTGLNASFTGDSSYSNAVEISVGAGYGGGALAQFGIEGFTPGFASVYDELLFKAKGLTADNTIVVKVEEPFPGTSVPVTVNLTAAGANIAVTDLGDGWSQVVIQMTAYGDVSTFSQIVFETVPGAYAEAANFYLTDIGFNNGGGGPVGGELLTNGTFETGDVSGWELVPNAGTFTATMDQAASGSWSGNLVASVPASGGPASFPLATQVGFARGAVSAGQNINVSFDICGVIEGVGGVFQSAILSEIDGGGASATNPLFGNIPLSETWTNYSTSLPAGPDVSGGITLQLKADCGGNPGCTVNAYVDNVSVTLDSDTGNVSNAGGACPIDTGGGGGGADVPVPFSTVIYDDAYADIWQTFICCGGAAITEEMAVDMSHGNVVQIDYLAGNTIAGLQYGTSELLDVSRYATGGGTLEFDALVTRAGMGEWKMKIEGVNGGEAVEVPLSASDEGLAPVEGVWQHYTFNIQDDLSGGSMNWSNLNLILFFSDFGNGLGAIQIDNLVFKEAGLVISENGFDDIWEGFVCCGGSTVTQETAADTAFGEVIQIDYAGGGTISGLKYGPGAELLDASAFATDGTLEFDALVSRAGNGDWKMKIEGSTGADAVEVPFTASAEGVAPVEGVWQHYTFDIASALSGGSLKWDEVKLLLFFSDFGNGLGQIQIDNLGFRAGGGGGGGGGGGEVAVNGGLESGLTGWETTPNGGTSELSSAEAHTGSNSAHLRADVAANGGGASFPDIKLANVGVGVVANGQAVTVSFWTKTVEQTGAVPFFAQLFTEQSGGGASKTDFLIQPPTFLATGDWQQHTFNVTLGPDASAGVSLLFKADCGASAGCVLDVFIDDVSIVAN